MRDETRKKQAFDFVTERASKLCTDPQQQHFVLVSHHTEHKSCVWPNNFGVRKACALAFSRSDPHSLEDTSKCKLMFTVLLALCLKEGQLKPFTHVPPTIIFLLWKSLKVMVANKSKLQQEAPSKQSALKGLKVMPYMELWQYIGLW